MDKHCSMSAYDQTDQINSVLRQIANLRRKGNWKDALELAGKLTENYPHECIPWMALSDINMHIGRYEEAINEARKARELDNKNARTHLQLAKCLVAGSRKIEALPVLKNAEKLVTDEAELNDAIGTIYSICDEPVMAAKFHSRSVRAKPDNPAYRSNLALVQRMIGEVYESEQNFDKAIEINPHDYRAYYARSDLKKWSTTNNHIVQMEKLLKNGIKDWRGEVSVHFALAKEYEDISDYDNAFINIKSACDLQRRHTRYSIEGDITTMRHIIAIHTAEAIAAMGAGYDTDEPMFIVGLPRTGTTLVERIISSHSSVYSAGELSNFTSALVNTVQGNNRKQKIPKRVMVEKALEINPEDLGKAYLKSTRPKTGHTPRFIDKFPFNYLNCGIIHAALPNAKIVLLERHPMDACFAMYRMMFMGIYPFSYDLDELGKYYIAYRALADHWQQALAGSIYVVHYEALVQDTENEIRKLLDYCNLDWEDACLNFHENKAASTTASAVQVRQPMYTSSLGKWKRYEEHLQPLAEVFRQQEIIVD